MEETRWRPVFLLVAVTLAEAIEAPVGSVTVPFKVPVPTSDWAKAREIEDKTIKKRVVTLKLI